MNTVWRSFGDIYADPTERANIDRIGRAMPGTRQASSRCRALGSRSEFTARSFK